jgi:hypothetical protein
MKYIIIILLVIAGLIPARVYAVEPEWCYAWIGSRNWTNIENIPYTQVKFNIQNNGIEDYNALRVKSDQFTQVLTTCPLGYTKDVTDPQDFTCTKPTGVIQPNEYLNITEAYSGESYYTGTITTPDYGGNTVGNPYDYWSNPENLGAIDNTYSDIDLIYPYTQWHNHETMSGFPISGIPAGATITGIDITIKGYATGDYTAHNIGVYLSRDLMATYQPNGASNDLLWLSVPSSGTIHTFSTDNTVAQFNNYNWKPEDFNNNPDFAVSLYADENNTHHFYVDYITVAVKYEIFNAGKFEIGIYNGSDTKWCVESALGTLYPDYSFQNGGSGSAIVKMGALPVPVSCASTDIICQFKAWIYALVDEYFGFDEEDFTEQYANFLLDTKDKIPFYYLYRMEADTTWRNPVVASSTAIPDFDMTLQPKLYRNGNPIIVDPIVIHIPHEQFDPIAPFIGQLRTIWKMALYIAMLVYAIGMARRIIGPI